MAAVFSRFSSLTTSHFRKIWFGQRIAQLCDEIDESRDLVQWQCLSAIVIMTTIAYLMVRGLDSLWALALIVPIILTGGASLQHALVFYRFYVHAQVMPSLCEAFGRLRYTIGDAPDLCLQRLVQTGLLPHHDRHLVDDVFFGDYRGHRLTLALVNLWHGEGRTSSIDVGEHWTMAVVITIQWPAEPDRLPADELSQIIGGHDCLNLTWAEGSLMLAIPCLASPFNLGGLFEPPEQFLWRLEQVAAVIQMPPNLIDYLLDQPTGAETPA